MGNAKISNIFGALEIPRVFFSFFFLLTINAGPEPTYEEKLRVPPPPVLDLPMHRLICITMEC